MGDHQIRVHTSGYLVMTLHGKRRDQRAIGASDEKVALLRQQSNGSVETAESAYGIVENSKSSKRKDQILSQENFFLLKLWQFALLVALIFLLAGSCCYQYMTAGDELSKVQLQLNVTQTNLTLAEAKLLEAREVSENLTKCKAELNDTKTNLNATQTNLTLVKEQLGNVTSQCPSGLASYLTGQIGSKIGFALPGQSIYEETTSKRWIIPRL